MLCFLNKQTSAELNSSISHILPVYSFLSPTFQSVYYFGTGHKRDTRTASPVTVPTTISAAVGRIGTSRGGRRQVHLTPTHGPIHNVRDSACYFVSINALSEIRARLQLCPLVSSASGSSCLAKTAPRSDTPSLAVNRRRARFQRHALLLLQTCY